ncbi:MAG: hypothetical protein EHM43_02570 [Ignavibacteriae bacterium]|nr:MAG: hypothetical protein EHM43_02570 [Ignavibacteriota bacterium]
MNIIDTVAGCSEVPEFSADIDGDGFLDVATDVGGGGYTARVIRGGPNAGRKCERILNVPYAPVEEGTNVNTCLFWRSSSAGFRLMQTEVKENRSWVVIYDVGFRHEGNTITTTFTPIDSLTGKGFGGPSHCALATDTLLKKDWLLMFRFDADINQNVLERFDATEGMFSPTGERVTGTEFYQPWVGGYSLGTQRPVIGFHATNIGTVYTYLDDLAHPFAWWNAAQSGVQPVSGRVAINDQTGDGIPDLVMAGGVTNGTVILLTLDSTASSVADNNDPQTQVSARMFGTTLEVVTTQPVMISAQLVTTDGRMFPTLPPTHGSAGVNRFDLTSAIDALPKGAYHVRVLIGEELSTVNFVR